MKEQQVLSRCELSLPRVVRRVEVNCGISRFPRKAYLSRPPLSDPPRDPCALPSSATFTEPPFSTRARVDSSASGIKTIAVETGEEDGEAWRIRLIVRLLSSSGFSGNDCGGGYTPFHSPEQTSAGEKNYFKRIAVCKERECDLVSISFQNKFKYKPS